MKLYGPANRIGFKINHCGSTTRHLSPTLVIKVTRTSFDITVITNCDSWYNSTNSMHYLCGVGVCKICSNCSNIIENSVSV